MKFKYYCIIFILVTIGLLYYKSLHYSVIEQLSPIDNNKYIVRDELDKQEAAKILSILKNKSTILINKLSELYPNDDKIRKLVTNYRPNNIYETSYKKNHTSYSVNKGQKIYICLRNINNEFVNINIIFFVMIHELAHIMTTTWDVSANKHSIEFRNNNKFLLNHATQFKLYKNINYENFPQPYCGIEINSNP